MNFKIPTLALVLSFLFASLSLSAQKTTTLSEAQLAFKKGMEFFDGKVYGLAQNEFRKTIELLLPVNEPEAKLLKQKAELNFAKCAVNLGQPEGENLIIEFARKNQPDPIANEALLDIANFYFNDKKFDKAMALYASIDTYALPSNQRSEVVFKIAYLNFIKKKFSLAKSQFRSIKDVQNDYYYPANYYYGMCNFFTKKYADAITSFQKASGSKRYKPYVPYYITSIYFAERDFSKVINYGVSKAEEKNVKNQADINRLVGRAYFEEGEFSMAKKYLEYAARRVKKMDASDYYQLGFVQYQSKEYKKAEANFKKLNREKNKMGQLAMYYLADCNLKSGDKRSARNAFANASRLNYDTKIQEESLWNYAKLSYEMRFDRDASDALQKVNPRSPNYAEAQGLLGDIFLNTRDYVKAMQIIERMPNKTTKIKQTYQKVAYYRGVQLAGDGDLDGAKQLFYKSLDSDFDARTSAMANYGLGEIAHQQKKYRESNQHLTKFLQAAKSLNNLPDGASVNTANYTVGYNYLKEKNYKSALGYFQDAVAGIKRDAPYIQDEYVKKQVLADATLRAGDALFKTNNYNSAIKYYDEAINKKYSGYVYALYQKAIIEGLRGNPTDQILALERLTEQYPKSEFTDDALLSLGNAYQDIGRTNQATAAFNKLVRNFKGKSSLVNQGLLKLGLIAYNSGDLQGAIKNYKDVFKNNPDPKEAEGALAALEEIYVDDLGQPDNYLRFRESLGGYDVSTAARDSINFKAAESQFDLGNYDKAITKYNDYIAKFPNGRHIIPAYFHRGESNTALKKYSAALRDYDYVINKGQSRYYEKGLRKASIISYNHEEDFEKAYGYYSKWADVASTEEAKFEAQLGTLRSAYRTGRTDAVYTMANKVSSNPRASQDQIAAANFYLGKMAFDKKDYDRAVASFNKVVTNSNNENTAEARYSIAYVYYVRRDLDVAENAAMNAIRENSSYQIWVAKSGLLLADIYVEQSNYFDARALLEGMISSYEGEAEVKDQVAEAKQKLAALNAKENRNNSLTNPDSDILELDETGGF
ncbi:MAG: tetratricopeptide repeat protein [Saprospiraceae bacterium]